MSGPSSSTVKRKWAFDLNTQETRSSQSTKHTSRADNTDLKRKKAWEVAKGPGKSILMTVFMLWMAGSGVNIFSIMITLYAIINPVKAILGTNGVFSKFEDNKHPLLQQKAVFIALNVLSLSFAVYKCSTMGLLPTTPSDWISMLPVKQPVEFSGGGSIFPL